MTVVKGKVKKSLCRADQLGRGFYAEDITLRPVSPPPIPPVLREQQCPVLSYVKGIQNDWLILHLYAQKKKKDLGICNLSLPRKQTNKRNHPENKYKSKQLDPALG